MSKAQAKRAPFDRQAAVAKYGKTLSKERARLRARFMAGEVDALATATALAVAMDNVLQSIWHDVGMAMDLDLANHLALLAVGGYGRGQMAPHSDVDLLFLRVSKQTELQDEAVEHILYVLWDMRLKVGQAVRTPQECLKLGADDATILTSLLDLRLIRGSRQGFQALRSAIDTRLLGPQRRSFVEAKMAEREARHQRQGQSRYALEPNVKENKGGLRDLHALAWISRAVFGDGQPSTLMSRGVFSLSQVTQFQAAEAFLMTVRLHLHYASDRPDEALSFDKQLEIAGRMGFDDRDQRRGVEAFMQAYFRVAKDVGALTGIIISTIETEFQSLNQGLITAWRSKAQVLEGFEVLHGRLAIRGAHQLAQQPLDFLRYFLVAHEHDLAHAPASLRLISQNLRLINAGMRKSVAANALFLALLTHSKNPIFALRTLNETGVLSAFLPEWESIVGAMQFNRYHSYTVDEHTLLAIDQLHKMRAGDLGDVTAPVHEALIQVDDHRALFVAMLYHDIAKGRPGQHEEVGADLAPAICQRLGLSEAETQLVAWLIRYHLHLSQAAFQRDLDDPRTLEAVAEWSPSGDALTQLYILTAADIRAVGPDVWSAWKGALLQRAYKGASNVLRGGEAEGRLEAIRQIREESAQALRAASPKSAHRAIDHFLQAAPEAYWRSYTPAQVVEHFALHQAAPTLEIQALKTRKAAQVTVCTADEPGLLARIAGAAATAGWSVEASKAHTFRDGQALDTFFLRLPESNRVPTAQELSQLETSLEAAISGSITLSALAEQMPRGRTKRQQAMDRPATCRIHHPESPTDPTLIEVSGPDRTALLFDLTATFMKHGTTLKAVRMATYGERFVNVFYVTDLMGQRLEGGDRLTRLQADLLTAAEEGVSL